MDMKRLLHEKTGPTWPHKTVVDVEAKTLCENMLAQFWTSYVMDEFDQFDPDKDIIFRRHCDYGQGQRLD